MNACDLVVLPYSQGREVHSLLDCMIFDTVPKLLQEKEQKD